MRRRKRACTDEFLANIPEGIVHSVHKVVTQSSLSVTWRHKASGDQWMFCTKNLGRYEASLEVVQPQNKSSNCERYRLWCERGYKITCKIQDIFDPNAGIY